MSFHVGQKVVCVDAVPHGRYSPWPHKPGLSDLKERAIYTVRAIGPYRDTPCVWLEEIQRKDFGFGEAGYSQQRFRPITERKTDISIFTKLLTPSKRERETV